MLEEKLTFLKLYFLFLIFPSIINSLLQTQLNEGNMGLYGVFLDLYRSRNIFYFCGVLTVMLVYYSYPLIGLFFVLFGFINYGLALDRWKDLLITKQSSELNADY